MEIAIEVILKPTKNNERWRWWQCGFCNTEFAMLSTKRGAVPGVCPNCKVPFDDWKEFACGTK